jgi:hypothetical protein
MIRSTRRKILRIEARMTRIAYPDAPTRIRGDLIGAHERAWQRLARAGCWWTGAERMAIANEVRHATECELCRARKRALSPASVDDTHTRATDTPLAPLVVDAVHRIVSDPGRLTRALPDAFVAEGLEPGHYVEMLGVIVTVYSIDQFARGLGLAPRPLPAAQPGAASHYSPEGLESRTGWVPMIGETALGPAEADLWDPPGGNVIRALSLVPDEVRTLMDLSDTHYLPGDRVMDPRAGGEVLDRAQIELVAARVSALNECFY